MPKQFRRAVTRISLEGLSDIMGLRGKGIKIIGIVCDSIETLQGSCRIVLEGGEIQPVEEGKPFKEVVLYYNARREIDSIEQN